MITGFVDSRIEPTVLLNLRGPTGREHRVSFVVDTGYSGNVLLPPVLIEALELKWVRVDIAELADCSHIQHRVFTAEVDWDGSFLQVTVDESDSTPLLGTALLRGYELKAEMRPHGKLTLKKLPPKKRKTRT